MTRSGSRRLPGILVLLGVATLAGACNGPVRPSHPPAQAADSVSEGSVDVVTAEHAVREFFARLVERRTADARALLAPGPRSDMSVEEMERAAAALRQVQVRKLAPLQLTGEQIVFQATLDVVPDAEEPGEWKAGANTRWIEVVHSRRGWRIARIASVPLPRSEQSLVTQWAQVHILEAGVSMEVPHAWQLHPGRWAWSPPGRSSSVVEVQWFDGARAAEAASPAEGARVVRTAPVEIRWGSGTEYALEVPAAPGGDSVARYRLHFVVQSSDAPRTIRVVGETQRREELRALRLVLRRMLTSMEFATPSSLTAEASRSKGE